MPSTILLVLAVAVSFYAIKYYLALRHHIAEAKTSGLPYVISPLYLYNRAVQVAVTFLAPVFRLLPNAWTESWIEFSTLDWPTRLKYEPFRKMGADTFLVVSAERIVMYTAEANVVSQITSRRSDFPKALEVYGMLKIYGENVVTQEGQKWRHHRKITSPPFSEKNNNLVWLESIQQTQAMIAGWFGDSVNKSPTVRSLAEDAMRLSLHVISKAGFGVHMDWPEKSDGKARNEAEKLENGHTMSYIDALGTLLHLILPVLIVPHGLLKILPFKVTKKAYQSYVEWGRYMNEMYSSKKAAVLEGREGEKLDLMVAMIKGAGVTKNHSAQTMSDREILGNAFVFILAGHETTANSIHFSLVLLAMNIAAQRRLQRDLDDIFQGKPANEWDYDRDLPKLFGSMAGAVLNEELRLYAPVPALPKSTPANSPQELLVDGKKRVVPKNVYIELVTQAIHRNKEQWPTTSPTDPNRPFHPRSNLDNDLEEFKPERWILDTEQKRTGAQKIYAKFCTNETPAEATAPAAALGVDMAPDTAANLYKPPKGAYIPFSEGYRSCLGKRFAQVEFFAVIAVIFSQYSVELAVDEWATDAEVEAMDQTKRREVWNRAKEKVRNQMNEDLGAIITLQMQKGHVPVRFVKRGMERFNFE